MSFIENFDLSYKLTLDLSFFFIIIIFLGEKNFGGRGFNWTPFQWMLLNWKLHIHYSTIATIKQPSVLGFVEPSFVWSGLTTRPDLNNVAWFLMGDLLRLGLVRVIVFFDVCFLYFCFS